MQRARVTRTRRTTTTTMADEARAMLDALMGADRNAALPPPSAHHSSDERGHPGTKRKRSCFDPATCPLYSAWGVDVHDLFTNTKSDIGPNPLICDDDAREEYVSLPQKEKDRLGFEHRLYDRVRDLVRGCDRIVNRNKDKLRQEVARNQRARGGRGDGDDPAANISDERIRGVAEDTVRVELLEEEVTKMVTELEELDGKEAAIMKELKPEKEAEDSTAADKTDTAEDMMEEAAKPENETEAEEKKEETKDADTTDEKADATTPTAEAPEEKKENGNNDVSVAATEETTAKSQQALADLRSQKHVLLPMLSSKLERLASLRDSIDSETRRLHHFRSDTTIDKCVCDVSGNFMSYRDADERIAAHYAGKQYVGWKMVRDKHAELKKRFGNLPPPQPMQQQQQQRNRGPPPPPPQHRGGGGGYGGHAYGGPPPPPQHGGYGGGGRGGYYDDRRGHGGGGWRDDRGGRGGGGRRRSPERWERDRYDRGGYGGGGGGGRRW